MRISKRRTHPLPLYLSREHRTNQGLVLIHFYLLPMKVANHNPIYKRCLQETNRFMKYHKRWIREEHGTEVRLSKEFSLQDGMRRIYLQRGTRRPHRLAGNNVQNFPGGTL
jgi:hypothetical protein